MSKISGKEHDFFKLFDKYTSAMRRGKHQWNSRQSIKKETLDNYFFLRKLLVNFSEEERIQLRIYSFNRRNIRELKSEQLYWRKFYQKFKNYLYDKQECYDNYVGVTIKMLRSFFKYLNEELEMNIGNFYKGFSSPHEDIQIVTLTPEQLNFLIRNKDFEKKLSEKQQRVKDLFVFGCRTALRVSDLLSLKPSNIEIINDRAYLKVLSKKTKTFTKVKLPQWAVDILHKYKGKKRSILPYYHKNILGKYIKELCELAGWTDTWEKTRMRRGQPVVIYKDPTQKLHYRFCDLVSTHTMRRTGVTYMLSLGMNPEAVRKISGHAAGSKEFFKYVSFSQSYLDKEGDETDKKLDELELVLG